MHRPTSPAIDRLWPPLLGLCYFCLSAVSVSLTRFDGGAAFIWLSSAPLFAFLLVRPAGRWWPALVCCGVGSCFSTTFFGIGPGGALPMAVALIGEAVLAAWLLQTLGVGADPFEAVPGFVKFVGVVGVVTPAVSGIPASLAIAASNGNSFLSAYLPWCAAHALGFLTLAPLLLLLTGKGMVAELRSLSRHHKGRALGLLAGLAGVCVGVFWQNRMPLLFLPMLPLVITAFTLGRLGATAAIAILALLGSGFTLAGHGPVALMHATPGVRAQFFQFYLAVAIMIVLPAAAELRRRERLFLRLQESEASLRLLTANFADAILRLDADGVARYASPSIVSLSGLTAEDVVGRRFGHLIVAEDLLAFETARQQALHDPSRTVAIEYRVMRALHEIEWREAQMRGYRDTGGDPAGVVLVIRDATARKLQHRALEVAAASDPLTGIANRRAFDAALAERLDRASSGGTACLALFDIDHFKLVNDTHGHAAGDRVLRAVAAEAQRTLRATDLLARVGGEEFGVLLPGLSLFEARAVCERLRERIADLSVAAETGREVAVTISVGLVEVQEGWSAPALYDAADRALYAAKHAGRNRLQIAA